MSENVLQTVQRILQDAVAPDVRELKVRLTAFQEQTAAQSAGVQNQLGGVQNQLAALQNQLAAVQTQFEGQLRGAQNQSEAQYRGLLAAIGEMKAQSELSNQRSLAALSERGAILEAASRHN